MYRALPRRACLLSMAALPLAARAQAPNTEVTLAMLAPSALMWVHLVAEKQGYYAARNIAVRELRVSDSPSLLQAVSSGSTDAGLSLGDLAIRAIDRGAPIVIVGAALGRATLRLIVPRDVTDAKGLNGKPVTAGAVRGGTADVMKFLVARGGGDPASLKMVSIANSRDRIVALQNGSVQGALLTSPFDVLAERAGFHMLDVYRAPYLETPLILNRDWAAKNRPAAGALVLAMKQAAGWMNGPENRTATADILAAYTNMPRDVCEAAYDITVVDLKAIPPDFAVVPEALQNIEMIDAASNGRPADAAPFRFDKYYDSSYLDESR